MVVWITGLPGAGKTTIGKRVNSEMSQLYNNTVLLDGDILREVIGDNAKYSKKDRLKKSKQYSRLCKMLSDQGLIVICCVVSMYDEVREWNRKNITDYFEIFINAPIETLVERDKKGLYSSALKGEVKDVIGINAKYERPKNSDLVIFNDSKAKLNTIVVEILQSIDW
ncbi:adenylyl-sulfate kinase [bacterium]|nr:adenylyl-sulfate kinase [bacterium]